MFLQISKPIQQKRLFPVCPSEPNHGVPSAFRKRDLTSELHRTQGANLCCYTTCTEACFCQNTCILKSHFDSSALVFSPVCLLFRKPVSKTVNFLQQPSQPPYRQEDCSGPPQVVYIDFVQKNLCFTAYMYI